MQSRSTGPIPLNRSHIDDAEAEAEVSPVDDVRRHRHHHHVGRG